MLLIFPAGAAAPPAEVPLKPTHSVVRIAVEATRDAELDAWTRAPGAYFLRATDAPELTQTRLWMLMPGGVGHPISVTLAVPATGAPEITTGDPQAVFDVLSQEPALALDLLPKVTHSLLRDHARSQVVKSGTAVKEGDGWRVTLSVFDEESGPEQWVVVLDGPRSAVTIMKGR